MSLAHYVTIGHSGLRVSPLCLGAMTFGKEWGWGSEPEDAKRILDAYIDHGGNFIDTANGYTKGHSMETIAKELGTTVPRIALSWVQHRPGVTSTIIGARTMEQLDDNVRALDVKLTADQIAKLDKATTPTLPFPVDMLGMVPAFAYGGTTINGQASKAWPQAPQNDSERF